MSRPWLVLVIGIVVGGCSSAPKMAPVGHAPSPPGQSPRAGGEQIALATEHDALVYELIASLSPEQVRRANLHHRLHPEYGGTHCKRGEGLGWQELNQKQQEILRRLWEMTSEQMGRMRAQWTGTGPGPSEPGTMENTELFGVGYGIMERRDGVHTTLHVASQRYPVATSLEVHLPGTPALPAAVQQEGIDLRATGAYEPPGEETQEQRN